MLAELGGDGLLVVINMQGRASGIPAMSNHTTGPILQATEDNPLWEILSGGYNGVVLIDRRGQVAYAHDQILPPGGIPTLRAEVAALLEEGDGT